MASIKIMSHTDKGIPVYAPCWIHLINKTDAYTQYDGIRLDTHAWNNAVMAELAQFHAKLVIDEDCLVFPNDEYMAAFILTWG